MRKIFLLVSVLLLPVLSIIAQEVIQRDFQLSFISPLGTNGLDSRVTSNKFSLNMLGGYSYGNTAFELGGIYNVNTDVTKGLQMSGVANYSGYGLNAFQIAGITNVMKKGTTPFQIAGVVNMADNANGLQLAGVVNVAKRLTGVQLGLINIADESEGVAVGLINIVKKNGKYEFELAFSEAWNTVISFKLGTDYFYTIFSGGVKYVKEPIEYGAGLGFGTHVCWKNGWSNQIELIGYAITTGKSFNHDGLNMLVQLKLPIAKEVCEHFKIFGGPVFNTTLSSLDKCSINPWSLGSTLSGKTKLNCWLGFVVGVRF